MHWAYEAGWLQVRVRKINLSPFLRCRQRDFKMASHKFCHADELLNAADRLGVKAHLLNEVMAEKYISFMLKKYKPWKTSGHLSIGEGTTKLPTDEKEFVFFYRLNLGRVGYFSSKTY